MKPISINMLCKYMSMYGMGTSIHVEIPRNRFTVLKDGGTSQPAQIFDGLGENLFEQIIKIEDVSIIRRPFIEKYVDKLNEDEAMYLIELCSYITGRNRVIYSDGYLILYPNLQYSVCN